jgi:hypothetical protein
VRGCTIGRNEILCVCISYDTRVIEVRENGARRRNQRKGKKG